ncbi:hypothetical protein GYA54_02045 [Candidatus Kuenenbacteria bacterium]|nr:hypothetical protein [Candidatus Kuenenbacteria bacterium]
MKNLVFLVFLVSVTFCMAADEEIGLGFWGRYDQVVFSKPVCVTAWTLWGVTAYELQAHPEQYEGYGHCVYGDHVNLGFGLHTLGYFLRNYYPEAWAKAGAARTLCRFGWLVELDDVVQHLVIQRWDNFGPGLTGQYKIGLVQKAYRWTIEPCRDNDRLKAMLTLFPVGRRGSLSVGYFQGPALQVSFGRFEVLPGVNFSSVVVASYGYCRKTELAVEQVFVGPEVEARVYKNFCLSAFAGVRTLDKRAGAREERLAYGWGINWGR